MESSEASVRKEPTSWFECFKRYWPIVPAFIFVLVCYHDKRDAVARALLAENKQAAAEARVVVADDRASAARMHAQQILNSANLTTVDALTKITAANREISSAKEDAARAMAEVRSVREELYRAQAAERKAVADATEERMARRELKREIARMEEAMEEFRRKIGALVAGHAAMAPAVPLGVYVVVIDGIERHIEVVAADSSTVKFYFKGEARVRYEPADYNAPGLYKYGPARPVPAREMAVADFLQCKGYPVRVFPLVSPSLSN